jgi:hypothetical protein
LQNKLYLECLELSRSYDKVNPFWGDLARKNGYNNPEALRSAFRRERTRRNEDPAQTRITQTKKRVVLFDIETLPMVSYHWGVWNENISTKQLIHDWCLLSWSAKDLMREEVRSDIMTVDEALGRDDERITRSLWQEFEDASILIGHNIVDFDVSRSNTRFLYYGMNPPSPYLTIDTLKIMKYNFSMTWNKLGYINQFLDLENKKYTNDGFSLWKGCAEGEQSALDEMLYYNKQDVFGLEDLYMSVRAWDTRHPNIGLYFDDAETRCKICGSKDLTYLDKPYQTKVALYQAVRCKECGAIGRKKDNLLSKASKDSLLR